MIALPSFIALPGRHTCDYENASPECVHRYANELPRQTRLKVMSQQLMLASCLPITEETANCSKTTFLQTPNLRHLSNRSTTTICGCDLKFVDHSFKSEQSLRRRICSNGSAHENTQLSTAGDDKCVAELPRRDGAATPAEARTGPLDYG
jgi:hypothetical protein